MDFLPKKKLGFGLMRLPLLDNNKADDVDYEQAEQMVDYFLDNGFTYFDTGLMYMGSKCETITKKILVDRHPRDSFALAAKLHADYFDSLEGRDEVLQSQLEKTGVEYFDYYLIHGIEQNLLKKYDKYDCFRWIAEKKEQGVAKHIGFSYHDTPELLDKLLTEHSEMEFVQLQINYLDWESEWVQARRCYEVCVKHKKPVVVMEPVKGGTLADMPEEAAAVLHQQDPSMSLASWAIRFVASLENVMLVLSGMSDMEQIKDNASYMTDFVPLTEVEKDACFQAAAIINSQTAIPCTGCSYCTEGCPQQIPIPKYFSLYNEDKREDLSKKGWTINITNYEFLTEKFGKASDCVECGQCESICPQHLSIISFLKDVVKHYEEME